MKNIVDKLMKLWTEKEKNWSKKSSTTVIFPCKIFSVFTVPRHEIRYEIRHEIRYEIRYEIRHEIRHEILPQIQHQKSNWKF